MFSPILRIIVFRSKIKSYFVYQYQRTCLLNTPNKVNTKDTWEYCVTGLQQWNKNKRLLLLRKKAKDWIENVQQIKDICNVNRKFSLGVEVVSVIAAIQLSVAIFLLLVFHCLTKLTILYSNQVKNEPAVLVKICLYCSIKKHREQFLIQIHKQLL